MSSVIAFYFCLIGRCGIRLVERVAGPMVVPCLLPRKKATLSRDLALGYTPFWASSFGPNISTIVHDGEN